MYVKQSQADVERPSKELLILAAKYCRQTVHIISKLYGVSHPQTTRYQATLTDILNLLDKAK